MHVLFKRPYYKLPVMRGNAYWVTSFLLLSPRDHHWYTATRGVGVWPSSGKAGDLEIAEDSRKIIGEPRELELRRESPDPESLKELEDARLCCCSVA